MAKLSILCDAGGNAAPVTVVITIPAQVLTSDPDTGIFSFVQSVQRAGFWDDLAQNFYPAVAIRKITPQ